MVQTTPAGNRWFHRVLLAASLLVLAAAFTLRVRDSHEVVVPGINQVVPGVCTFRELTGYRCPGCGLTRAFVSLAHGRWRAAWNYNPAGILFFAMVAFQVPYRTYQLWRLRQGRGEFHFVRADRWAVIILVVALLAQWSLRIVLADS